MTNSVKITWPSCDVTSNEVQDFRGIAAILVPWNGVCTTVEVCGLCGEHEGMLKQLKSKKRFSLTELIIVAANIGLLAALAIPSYSDYAAKARLTEILVALDDIAAKAIEYHKVTNEFPNKMGLFVDSHKKNKLLTKYGTISAQKHKCDATQGVYGIRKLRGISDVVNECKVFVTIAYDTHSGYQKSWDVNLPSRYVPGSAQGS